MILGRPRLDAFALPLRRPLVTARGEIAHRRGVVLRIAGRPGMVGAAEVAPHPLDAASLGRDAALDAVGAATRWLEGASLERLDELLEEAQRFPRWIAAGIDCALHDLAARATGRRVVDVLGGCRRERIDANATLPGAAPAELAGEARAAARAGFTAVKFKLSRDLDGVVEQVRAVRLAAPNAAVRGDANGAWDEAAALGALPRLAAQGLDLLEQPLAPGDLAGLAHLRRAAGALGARAPGRLRIAADEAVGGAADVEALARGEAVDVVVLKLCQTGGLAEALRAARAAERAGLAAVVTTALDASLATAAALHLAAALPGALEPCGVATAGLLRGDLVASPIGAAPRMPLPCGPGLGVEVDDAELARWSAA